MFRVCLGMKRVAGNQINLSLNRVVEVACFGESSIHPIRYILEAQSCYALCLYLQNSCTGPIFLHSVFHFNNVLQDCKMQQGVISSRWNCWVFELAHLRDGSHLKAEDFLFFQALSLLGYTTILLLHCPSLTCFHPLCCCQLCHSQLLKTILSRHKPFSDISVFDHQIL